MAYIEKHFITFCTKHGKKARISILKLDYVGFSTEIIGQPTPILINYDSEEDFKFSPIRASSCEINMVFDSDGVGFEDLWTADERDYKIEFFVDSKLFWTGFVIPNGFRYDFTGGLYYATMTAADGLGTLEDYIFRDETTNKPYGNSDLTYNDGFKFPFSLIATEILRKLGLDLDLWNCVNSYEKSMVKTGNTRNADPLSASMVDVRTYIKESDETNKPYWSLKGEEWNCREVLENLLHIFGAKVYQEGGVWRIKSIDSDVDYGSGATQLYWRKFNTLSVYLGQEIINDIHTIPCNSSGAYLLGNNHTMSMDYVYGAFRINYEYTFLREGDTPLNLLKNGNFANFTNDSKLDAPDSWYRWRDGNKWYIRLQEVDVTPPSDTNGISTAIEIGTQKNGIDSSGTDPNPAIWTALRTENEMYVEKGSKIYFQTWNKYRALSLDRKVSYAPIYRLILYTISGKKYYLRNGKEQEPMGFTWEDTNIVTESGYRRIGGNSRGEINVTGTHFFSLDSYLMVREGTRSRGGGAGVDTNIQDTEYGWRFFSFDLPDAPEAGWLDFSIHGLAASTGRDSGNFPAFTTWIQNMYRSLNSPWQLGRKWRVVRENWIDQGGDIPRLQVTGFSLGVIQDEGELPAQQDYVYENQNPNYSYEVDPITIFNGDVQDASHISNITVPSNTTGEKNFWDTIKNEFERSSIGLLTVKQIMRQYFKPYRILEGSIRIDNATFGGVYGIPTLEGLRFILQRASFDVKNQIISEGTFIQISGEILPEGGTEGGLTTNADWRETGIVFCQKVDNVNNGHVIVEQRDENPNSKTFGQFRNIVSEDEDLTLCPIGEPWQYYFGVDDVSMQIENLNTYPIDIISPNEIQVSYNNDGVKYLYLVHLASLGVVERIYTMTQPNNVISDWVYLSDITINGYLYRVLRTDYTMINFSAYPHNFVFNN